eukprot:gene12628-14597_t
MSSKNEQYEISGCELEFLDGIYSYNTKLESHVHQSGKFHLFRTNKDYIWMITDATRRKQYCFAQKIAPFPTMCNWNVFTGGDGVKGELIASNMKVMVTSEPSTTVSPPKRPLSSFSSSKLSPIGSSQSSAKLDSAKKSSSKVDSPMPVNATAKPVAPALKRVSAGVSPVPANTLISSTKPTPEMAAVQARQVIANAAANILSGNKGATVVRKSESFKINSVTQETGLHSLEVSPTVTPSTTYSQPAIEVNAVILLVPSLEDGFLQVLAPAEVTRSLPDREAMSAPSFTDLKAIATAWADTTVQLDREVSRAHQRVQELEQEADTMRQSHGDLNNLLQQRTAELEVMQVSFQRSQEQAQTAQEALREAVAQAKLIQQEIALEREDAAQERARNAFDEATAAQLRAQTALETAKSVQAQVEAMRAELDATEAHAQATLEEADKYQEQMSLALKRAQLAETLERDTQQQLQVARSQVQELQVALDLASYTAEPIDMPTFEVSHFSERSAQLRIEELERVVENLQSALDKSLTIHYISSLSSADSAAAALEVRAGEVAESVESARYIGELETLVSEKSSQLQTSADQMKVNSDRAETARVESARYVGELETLEEADKYQEQMSLALKRAQLAETLERDTQQQLQMARSQVQELQVALDLASYAAEPIAMPNFEVSDQSAQLRIEELEGLVENLQAALDDSLKLHTINSQSSADSAAAALEVRAGEVADNAKSARYIGELETLVSEKSSQLQTSADQMKVNSDRAETARVENARYVGELETLVQTSADQMKVNSDKADTERVENARYVGELETLVSEKSSQLQTSADQMKVNSDKANTERVESARYVGELETLVQTSADQMKVNSDKADTERFESARYVGELKTLVQNSADQMKVNSDRADTDRVENARYVGELETLVQNSADQMKFNSDRADTERTESARYVGELETLVSEKSSQLQSSADQMKVNSDKADTDRVENARYVGELETLVSEKSSQLQTSSDQMKENSDRADTERVESARYVDELETLVSEKSTQLKTSAHKLKESSQRADTLVARSAKRHMKRGTELKSRAEFPDGEDFRRLFVSDLANFETFACDAVNCLQDLGHPDDAAEVLVNEVLAPIFNVCHKYVHDKLEAKRALFKTEWGVDVNTDAVDDTADKLFWFTSMQPWLLPHIDAMSNTALMSLVRSMGLPVTDLHCSMVTAGTAGLIDNTEGAMRIPALTHVLLRCFTISALSDPKCYLYPAPGVRVPYKKGYTEDIMGLGTNKHGPIEEGEEVEVVLCGLYFDNPDQTEGDTVKPIVSALVRRLK